MSEADDKRPYAAAANVIGVLQRARTRNLPERLDNDFLRLAGVPEVVFGRVASALRFLELITEEGRPTETLRALSAAPDEEYKQLLSGAIEAAYAAEFQRVDPAQDSQKQIIDAFRPYQPRSQTQRMVMLFLALCREAGISVKDAPRERGMRGPNAGSRTPKPGTTRKASMEAAPGGSQGRRGGLSGGAVQRPPQASGLLFGVTEEDIGVLTDEQFSAVWGALGTVARARAQARSSEDEKAAQASRDNEPGEEDVP